MHDGISERGTTRSLIAVRTECCDWLEPRQVVLVIGCQDSLQGYQVSKITDLRHNSDRRYCEKTQFNIRGLRAPETVPYLALLPSRKVIPGFRISRS